MLLRAAAILTADICLRFIPEILMQLDRADVEDPLIKILKSILHEWHFSGLLGKEILKAVEFGSAFENQCLLQTYVDRVIDKKQTQIAQQEKIKPHILASLGGYRDIFWKDFN